MVARRLGFASVPLAVLAVLIGSQSVNLLISMHADSDVPWIWNRSYGDVSTDEWINAAKWAALAVLLWFWYVPLRPALARHSLGACITASSWSRSCSACSS